MSKDTEFITIIGAEKHCNIIKNTVKRLHKKQFSTQFFAKNKKLIKPYDLRLQKTIKTKGVTKQYIY